MVVDFHSHSNVSDGTLDPQALADFMAERKVEIFSHLRSRYARGLRTSSRPQRARAYVTGIEINTTWRENEVHVLGL